MAAWQALPKEQRPGSSLPALCHRNTQWWSRTYGHGNKPVANEKSSPFDAFYRAIRDNQVERVQSYIAQNPTAVFTKVFGENQRTALYVASFFGRHKVVKLLLHRGADKNLQCHGVRPIDVAGFASTDPIDRMKVRALLEGASCPQVILRLNNAHSPGSSPGSAASEARRFRVEIHFSESVDEFTQEDVTVSDGCDVTHFLMLRRDLYLATVQLAKGSREASVEILAGAARAAVGGRCSARSRPLLLQLA